MPRTIALTALLAVALLALGTAGAAHAVHPRVIIDDCTDSETGLLSGTYTKGDLRRAMGRVRGDIAEYTNCWEAIRAALASNSRPRGGGNDGGGSDGGDGGTGADTSGGAFGADMPGGDVAGSTGGGGASSANDSGGGAAGDDDEVVVGGGAPPVQQTGLPQAGSNAPVRLAGATIRPGALSSLGSDANELPSALIVLLVVLGAGALGLAGTTLGRRVLARRRA